MNHLLSLLEKGVGLCAFRVKALLLITHAGRETVNCGGYIYIYRGNPTPDDMTKTHNLWYFGLSSSLTCFLLLVVTSTGESLRANI